MPSLVSCVTHLKLNVLKYIEENVYHYFKLHSIATLRISECIIMYHLLVTVGGCSHDLNFNFKAVINGDSNSIVTPLVECLPSVHRA